LKKRKKNSILLVLPYLGCLESTPNHILGIGELMKEGGIYLC